MANKYLLTYLQQFIYDYLHMLSHFHHLFCMFNFLYNKLPSYFPFFSFFSVYSLKLSAYHSSLTLQFALCFLFSVPYSVSNFLFAYVALLVQYPVIVSISLSWPCPAFNNNSHSSLICDYFQFLLTICLCLSSLHAFYSIHPCPSCSLNYLCCAIHPYHFTLSALDPVCCCILTASQFSALFFTHDCHSMHTYYSMDTFPIPHAPPCSRPQSRCLIHIISCRFMLVASFLMPSFQFTYATCPIYATH